MCSVFGMLSAHLCRGRKVWQLVVLTLLVPILHALVWFCSWGGAALRQDRQATELQMLGTDYFNNSAHFLADGSQYCYDVPQEDVIVGNTTIFTNYLPKVTPVCQYDSTIPRANVLNVLNAFRVADFFGDAGAGPFFVVLFALACALNLIASSDSTSLMVDGLVSNARKNYHWLRRLFWAATIGILTTALIASGGPHFRDAIEALIVVSTVPMLFVMCLIVHPTFDLCRAANEHQSLAEVEYCVPKNQPEFAMPLYGGIFNVVEYTMSLGRVDAARVALGMDHATTFHVVECVKGLVVPFVSLHHVLRTTYPQNSKTNAVIVGGYALCYLAWFGVWAASLSGSYPDSGLNGIKWTFLAICGGTLGTVRSSFRRKYGLRSHIVADVMASFLLWPQVLTQMRMHCVLATNGLSTESLNDAVPASESSDQDDEFA